VSERGAHGDDGRWRPPGRGAASSVLPALALVLGSGLLALVLALAGAGAVRLGLGGAEAPAGGGPSPAERPGPETPALPGVTVRFPSPARAGDLRLRVSPVPWGLPCTTHTLGGVPAFLGGCEGRPGVYLFRVVVRNEGGARLPFRLANFVLVDRLGDLHAPVPLGGRLGGTPFLPRFALVPPGRSLAGWVAFESGRGFLPDRLTYPFGADLVVVAFEGEHDLRPPP
jgi:hypothetical protein